MLVAFSIFEQRADIVVRATWQQGAHPHGLNAKRCGLIGGTPLGQPSAQIIVDDRLERAPCFARLGLEARGNVIIEGESSAHTS